MDFNHCLWFIPSEDHIWNTYTNGFNAHLTIKSKLEYHEALELYQSIETQEPIEVRLKDELVYSINDGFHALYYVIEIINGKTPKWWNNNPHISFRYQYNKPFSDDEIKEVKNLVKCKIGILNKVKLVNCQNQYETWHFLQ